MFYKYVLARGLWWNTGITAYGVKPVNADGVAWVRPWEVPS